MLSRRLAVISNLAGVVRFGVVYVTDEPRMYTIQLAPSVDVACHMCSHSGKYYTPNKASCHASYPGAIS